MYGGAGRVGVDGFSAFACVAGWLAGGVISAVTTTSCIHLSTSHLGARPFDRIVRFQARYQVQSRRSGSAGWMVELRAGCLSTVVTEGRR